MPFKAQSNQKVKRDSAKNQKTSENSHPDIEEASIPNFDVLRMKANPKHLSSNEVLQLQHTIGNQAVARMLGKNNHLTFTNPVPMVQQTPAVIQRDLNYYTGYGEDSWRGSYGLGWRDKGKEYWEQITAIYGEIQTALKTIGAEEALFENHELKSIQTLKTKLATLESEQVKFSVAPKVIGDLKGFRGQLNAIIKAKDVRVKQAKEEEIAEQARILEEERLEKEEKERLARESKEKALADKQTTRDKAQQEKLVKAANREKQRLEAEQKLKQQLEDKANTKKARKAEKAQEQALKQEEEAKKVKLKQDQEAAAKKRKEKLETNWQPVQKTWDSLVSEEEKHTEQLIHTEKIKSWDWKPKFSEIFSKALTNAKKRGPGNLKNSFLIAHDNWAEEVGKAQNKHAISKAGTVEQWRSWLGMNSYVVEEDLDFYDGHEIHVTYDSTMLQAPPTVVGKTVDEVLSSILKVHSETGRIHSTITYNTHKGAKNPHVYWPYFHLNKRNGQPIYPADGWEAAAEKMEDVLHDYVNKHFRPIVAEKLPQLTYDAYTWPAGTVIYEAVNPTKSQEAIIV